MTPPSSHTTVGTVPYTAVLFKYWLSSSFVSTAATEWHAVYGESSCRVLGTLHEPHFSGSKTPNQSAWDGTYTQQVTFWIAFAHQLSSVRQDASRHA